MHKYMTSLHQCAALYLTVNSIALVDLPVRVFQWQSSPYARHLMKSRQKKQSKHSVSSRLEAPGINLRRITRPHVRVQSLAQPMTRALMRVVGESSSTSIGRSVLTSSSDSRALIGSSTGLAERDISNCGTISLMLLACACDTGVPSSTRESRLRGSFWRNPSSSPTRSMLLKYLDDISIAIFRGPE